MAEVFIFTLSLVLLICFFFLCANLATIKRFLSKKDTNYWILEFKKANAFNRDEEAKRYLEELITCEVQSINNSNNNRAFREEAYTNLRDVKYKQQLVHYKVVFPDSDKLNSF